MNPLRVLKSEYVYQPGQLVRRLLAARRADGGTAAALARARLPGGCEMDVSAADGVGRAVLHLGVFDLLVTEALWRLLDRGETAVDAGANVGYMTAVLAARAAPGGTVHAFEPHPGLFDELSRNAARWAGQLRGVRVHAHPVALSDRAGTAELAVFDPGAVNRGTSSVSADARPGRAVTVPTARLDDLLELAGPVGVMKVDVEGHELPLLRGAGRLLAEGSIRDVVFEEHRPHPTPVTDLLRDRGYAVFRLRRRFNRPELLPPDSHVPRSTWESTSFLATRDPARAAERFARAGWDCLRPGSRQARR